jgi:hypothetical protein
MTRERNAGARPPAGSQRAIRCDRRSTLPSLRVFTTRARDGASIGGRAGWQTARIFAEQDTGSIVAIIEHPQNPGANNSRR